VIKLPSILEIWGERISGQTVIQATINHNVHHQNPGIATRHLTTARPYMMISSSN